MDDEQTPIVIKVSNDSELIVLRTCIVFWNPSFDGIPRIYCFEQ